MTKGKDLETVSEPTNNPKIQPDPATVEVSPNIKEDTPVPVKVP